MPNGIVVFVSKGPMIDDELGPTEYRVAYVDDVPSLYDGRFEETGEPLPNKDNILDAFYDKDIYTNPDDAFAHADTLAARYDGELDYGVCLFNNFQNIEFSAY